MKIKGQDSQTGKSVKARQKSARVREKQSERVKEGWGYDEINKKQEHK